MAKTRFTAEGSVPVSSTVYIPLGLGAISPGLSNYQARGDWNVAGVLSGFAIRVATNTATADLTCNINIANTLQEAGTDAVPIVIGAGLTGDFMNAVDTVSIAAGQFAIAKLSRGAGSGVATVSRISAMFEATANTVLPVVAPGNGSLAGLGAFRYWPVAGDLAQASTTHASAASTVRAACTWKSLSIHIGFNTRTTTSSWQSYINAGAGAQFISVLAHATGTFSDLAHADALAAGDTISVRTYVGTGSGSITYYRVSSVLGSTDDSFLLGGVRGSPVSYNSNMGEIYSAPAMPSVVAEATAQEVMRLGVTLAKLMFQIIAASAGSTTTVRTRINGVNGNCVVVSGAGLTGTFEDTVNTDSTGSADLLAYSVTVAGGAGLTVTVNRIQGWLTVSASTAWQLAGLLAGVGAVSAHLLRASALAAVGAGRGTSAATIVRALVACGAVLGRGRAGGFLARFATLAGSLGGAGRAAGRACVVAVLAVSVRGTGVVWGAMVRVLVLVTRVDGLAAAKGLLARTGGLLGRSVGQCVVTAKAGLLGALTGPLRGLGRLLGVLVRRHTPAAPVCRTLLVAPEDRTMIVQAEQREFAVPREARTFGVPADDRTFAVPAASREFKA